VEFKKKNKVVVYGLGTLAQYVAYVIQEDTDSTVVAYTVDENYLPKGEQTLDDLPIIPFKKLENHFSSENCRVFIAVGDNTAREKIFNLVKMRGYNFFNYVSSKAIVWKNLKIGQNVFIGEDTGIQPFVTIGDNCILFAPRLGHHSSIGSHCLLSCCFLAGNVSIGDNVFVALTASIHQGVKIADNSIIGMGCSITKDTDIGDVYTTSGSTIKLSKKKAELIRKRFLL
jgi:sugar O-acyltransferase (sialic acid O-acetyltransferase NeuD family)